jgi:hypothetical protein
MSNLSLESFNQSFQTHIRGFENGHTDETGSYLFGVGFNVICNNNRRVMYFESHVGSNMLPSNYTNNDVIDAAWTDVLSNVKAWTTVVENSSNILGAAFVPSVATNSNLDFTTTSNFYYTTFSSNFDVLIQRMETYPQNNPSSWCVGFKVAKKNDSNASMYIDTQVTVTTFAIYQAEQEILDLGWANLKERIGQWAEPLHLSSQVLNAQYMPSEW